MAGAPRMDPVRAFLRAICGLFVATAAIPVGLFLSQGPAWRDAAHKCHPPLPLFPESVDAWLQGFVTHASIFVIVPGLVFAIGLAMMRERRMALVVGAAVVFYVVGIPLSSILRGCPDT
jgi:hypothetical protein